MNWLRRVFTVYQVVEIPEADRRVFEEVPREALIGLQHNLAFQWLMREIRLRKYELTSALITAKDDDVKKCQARVEATQWLEKLMLNYAQIPIKREVPKSFEQRMFDKARESIHEISQA